MKKLLIILAILITPALTDAGGPRERTWFCRQNGHLDGKIFMVVSETWQDMYPNHYDKRQESFSEHIKKLTEGKFRPMFEAKCREYYNPKQAEKHRLQEMKTAKKYDATIVELKWRWDPNVRKK